MKKLSWIILVVSIIACQTQHSTDHFLNGKWIDLSYAFDEQTIYWPTSDKFALDTVSEGMTDGGYYYSAFSFCMAEHGGTHLDAPIHFAEGKHSTDEIPIERLIGDGVVIDVSENALGNPDYQVTVEDLTNWEEEYQSTIKGKIVLIKTGFGRYWPDPEKYMGTSDRGSGAVAKLHFPGISPEAAEWIVNNRNIKAIGLDTPSIDYGQSKLFEAHRILFEKNIPAFENVANLDQLPISGSTIFALPIKIKGGSGGPMRMVAFIPA